MNRPTLLNTIIAVLAFVMGAGADEIYFDTVSTRKASRDQGSYIGVFGGGSRSQDADFRGVLEGNRLEKDDGWLAGIEFGYEFQLVRPINAFFEAEFTFMSMAMNGGGHRSGYESDLRSLNAMLNFGLQLNLDDSRNQVGDFWANFRPFAGVGVGGAWSRSSNRKAFVEGSPVRIGGSEKDLEWAYQVFAGVEYAFSDTFSIYGEWRRMMISEVNDGSISDPEFDMWLLGMKFKY